MLFLLFIFIKFIGIFNVSQISKQFVYTETLENVEDTFRTIVDSAANLDEVSRKFCPQLEYFVYFSTTASGRGEANNIACGMAYSAVERLSEKRKEDNLPSLVIQFGPISLMSDESVSISAEVTQKFF